MVFVDANAVLELLLPNRKHIREVAAILGASDNLCISMLSVHLAWHFGRQEQIADESIAEMLDDYTVVDMTVEDYVWARTYEEGKDFEDALQLATALRTGCDTFITLDTRLAKRYTRLPLRIVVP